MTGITSMMSAALGNAQIGIRTTANNVSNAATPGYSRQRVNLGTSPSLRLSADIWIGTGASVQTIQRMNNQLLTHQVNVTQSSAYKAQTYVENFAQLDMLLSNLENSMGTTLGEFTAAASAMAAEPSSSSIRDRFMAASSAVASRFHEMSVHMDAITSALNQQVEQSAGDINSFTQQIAALNKSPNISANDLQDERDRLIAKISEKIAVTVVPTNQGTVDVFLPNGQPLVVRDKAFALTTYRNDDDPTNIEIGFDSGAGPVPIAGGALTGGTLAGIAAFRQEGLKMAQNELGRMAIAMADAANAAHQLGQTGEGVEGGALFSYSQPVVHTMLANTGTAQLGATVTDAKQITAATYKVHYDGAQWSITRSTDGNTVTSAALPATVDGFQLSVASGSVAAGDNFTIDPGRSGAGSIRFLLNSPKQIAVGFPNGVTDASANSGTAKSVDVAPTSAPWNAAIKAAADVVYTGPGTFTVNGVAPTSITATAQGWEVEANGWKLTISGTPTVGDTFRVRATAGEGDGRNAQSLADLRKAPIVGGQSTVAAAYSRLVNSVGTKSAIAQTSLTTAEALAEQALTKRDNVTGVNLDEEASELMRWQQMYQAALKVTQTADDMLDSLFAALG